MKKIELLAPAGNFDCLKAAVNNGADAVYLGGRSFSARAFANNFDNSEIVEAIKYAHLRNVKVYVTINTLLNDNELDNAFKQAEFLYKNNVDAILVQDLGLFYRLRKELPNLELHASTQMHIHNLQGVKNAAKLGFKRVVLARESSLDLLADCTKENIEIECFVHGAICVSYSGQCLMSSVTKNRSANKGMCAQCCRLKYNLYQNNKKVNTDTDYLLSTKDMYLLEDIPNLIENGISSLKIEGRMKSSAYVGYVTRLYRKAIDSYYEGNKYKPSIEEIENLKLLFNRGFTNSYLKDDNFDIFSNLRPNHMGIKIGKVISTSGRKAYIKLDKDINQFDGIRILNQTKDQGLILNRLIVNNLLVSKAFSNETIEVTLENTVDIGDIVVKTLDYELEKTINNSQDKRIDIELDIDAKPNNPLFIKCKLLDKVFNYQTSFDLEAALKQPITNENIINSFNSTNDHPYFVRKHNISLVNVFISLKNLNEIRRDFYDKLDNFVLERDIKNIDRLDLPEIEPFNQDYCLYLNDLYPINPLINIDSKYLNNGVIKEFGGILLEGRKCAYYTLNVTNSYAFEFLLKLGFKEIILSTELDISNIELLVERFKDRCNFDIKPYVMIKGRRTLMNIKRNPFKKYISNNNNLRLSDGVNVYDVLVNSTYTEIKEIKNSIEIEENRNIFNIYIEE